MLFKQVLTLVKKMRPNRSLEGRRGVGGEVFYRIIKQIITFIRRGRTAPKPAAPVPGVGGKDPC
jgi:hypothetical protein